MWYTVRTSSDVVFRGCKWLCHVISMWKHEYSHTVNWSLTFGRLLEKNSTWKPNSDNNNRKFFNAIWQSMAFGTNAQLEQCIENGIHLIVCNNDENKMPIRRLLRWLLFSICKHCVFAIALQWIFCYTLRCKPRKLWATRTPFTISYTPSFCFLVFLLNRFLMLDGLCKLVPFQLLCIHYYIHSIRFVHFGRLSNIFMLM